MNKFKVIYALKSNPTAIVEQFNDYNSALNRYYNISAMSPDFIRIEEVNLNESTQQLLVE